MKAGRLRHAADTLCKMFCGWRLVNSYAEIRKLGSGDLVIDALTGACSFNGEPVASPNIAGELNAWLTLDLSKHSIEIADIVSAELMVTMNVALLERKKSGRPSAYFFTDSKHVQSKRNVHCIIHCQSKIVTLNTEYGASLSHVEQWPEEFAASSDPAPAGPANIEAAHGVNQEL